MLTTCPPEHKLPPVGRIRSTPIESDRRLLNLIQLKLTGFSWPEAAAQAGYSSWQIAQSAARKVIADDIAFSGESAEIVRAGYW